MSELEKWFEIFSEIGRAEGGGYYRGSYTPEEAELCRHLSAWMKNAGLEVRRDAAGNLWGRIEGTDKTALPVVVGSHIDSVRNGGNYDGIFGVLGGLAAVKTLIEKHGRPKNTLELAAFTGEEGSRFSIGLMGSHAAAGTLPQTFIEKTDSDGVSITEAMAKVGLDASKISEAVRGKHKAYLEMHIEQGPMLENAGIPIGIVDSIVGTQQFHVTMRGVAGHAGTVPMAMRKDPMIYAARAITRFPQIAINSGDGVITVGRIWTKPDAENVIPSEVTFTVDLRHPIEGIKREMADAVKAVCEEEARPSGLEMVWAEYPNNLAIDMEPRFKAIIEESCRELGYDYMHMPSGAGHDTLNMVKLGPVAMIFIPCRGGRSHCPEEYASPEEIQRGVDVMERCLYKLAYEDRTE